MDTNTFQKWLKDYYETQGWSELDIFIHIFYLAEETGQVARAIRALENAGDRSDESVDTYTENKQKLIEELGDVLGNVTVIANKYDISLEDILISYQNKLSKRYN